MESVSEKPAHEKKVKTSAAVWLGLANSMTGVLAAFAEGTAVTYFYQNVMGHGSRQQLYRGCLDLIWHLERH